MFQIKVTENDGKVWNFDMTGDTWEVWTSKNGEEYTWEYVTALTRGEVLLEVAHMISKVSK